MPIVACGKYRAGCTRGVLHYQFQRALLQTLASVGRNEIFDDDCAVARKRIPYRFAAARKFINVAAMDQLPSPFTIFDCFQACQNIAIPAAIFVGFQRAAKA